MRRRDKSESVAGLTIGQTNTDRRREGIHLSAAGTGG